MEILAIFESCFDMAAVYETVTGSGAVLYENAAPEIFADTETAVHYLTTHGFWEA